MREIKFRAWDGVAMHEDVVVYSENSVIVESDSFHLEDDIISVKNIMQYTGLKDKNGVEIYEGDIIYVHGDSFVGKVLFDGTAVCWCVEIYNDKTKIELMTLKRFIYSREKAVNGKLEVIGNIYENLELLE